ncbi:MAG: hypothetical protein V5A46_02970 [Haloferacaceae archaeon]
MKVAFAGAEADDLGLADVLEGRDGSIVPISDADVVVAVGESALLTLAREGVDVPVLPVAAGQGRHVVAKPDAADALGSVLDGEARRVTHSRLQVVVDGGRVATALYDVALVTTDPARISEYVVDEAGETLASVRSDGIVVATPAGSAGYAKAADGPVLSPGTGLSVVPVAPFTTHPEAWVVDGEVSITVAREDDVSLIADETVVRKVGSGEPVTIRRGEPVVLLRLPRQ